MNKISAISGFPEWLPQQKIVEDRIVDTIKAIFRSHGFLPIETPAVELKSTLASKGIVDREIYEIKRIHAETDEEADLALHFDLTVPFARYVALHFNNLQFPFKRYQMQKVWRGERPQKGRFREFYQFDIDIIGRDDLPLACDAEVLTACEKAFKAINIGRYELKINNRKILLGYYHSIGLTDSQAKGAITAVDKLHKIGPEGVKAELWSTCGISSEKAAMIVDFASVKVTPNDALQVLSSLDIKDDLFQIGIKEVSTLFGLIPHSSLPSFALDLSMARGLDYYTGTIFELTLCEHPEFGSVCSGGRYDDLASQFINKKLPGVGGSIGLSRLMEFIFSKDLISAEKVAPVQVLVAVYSEEQRPRCIEIAERLRKSGASADVYFKSPKLGKQIDFAADREIPFVLFLDEQGGIEVKNLRTKEQIAIQNLEDWCLQSICKK